MSRGAWDHPRVRGEQDDISEFTNTSEGSPPRARGAGQRLRDRVRPAGITPACAGSRTRRTRRRPSARDHPRVRGEQQCSGFEPVDDLGSPPRARGAVRPAPVSCISRGITPACAGSRADRAGPAGSARDHPRVRGEQAGARTSNCTTAGSPPRARGAGDVRAAGLGAAGITPACAGSRACWRSFALRGGDHPRVRGEQVTGAANGTTVPGSPPRARGAAVQLVAVLRAGRITPACAGSRAWRACGR